MNPLRCVRRGCALLTCRLLSCFAAFLSGFVSAASAQSGLAGAYFGNIGQDAGRFALHVRPDLSAVFLGYAPESGVALTALELRVDPAGHFAFAQGAATALLPLEGGLPRASVLGSVSITGNVRADGSLSGTASGALRGALAGTRSAGTGPVAAPAGFYEAGELAAGGVAFAIVAGSGELFALAQSGSFIDAARGTLGAAGTATLVGARSTLSVTISATGGLTLAATGAVAGTFAGASETAIASQRLANFSARARVVAGDGVAIAGFVIGGGTPRSVLVRAVGPSLAAFGVDGVLVAPRLELRAGNVLVATNTGIATSPRAAAIAQAAAQVGAFPLAANTADSAILATLAPGAYTAVVTGSDPGIALVEVYDVAAGPGLQNVSVRAIAGATPADTMIAGFVIPPGAARRVLLRGVGPGLVPFGVAGGLSGPALTLRQGATVRAQSERWAIENDAAAIADAAAASGAFPLAGADSAWLGTLAPGDYTVTLRGVGAETGAALFELYEAPPRQARLADVARLRSLSPLPPIPADLTNAVADHPGAAVLGQKFFFDRGYSGPLGQVGVTGGLGSLGQPGRVSCATCHDPGYAFADPRGAISAGATALQTRNTPTLINIAHYKWFNWSGNRDTLWVAGTAVGSANGSLLSVAHRVHDAYRDDYNAVFSPPLPDLRNSARFPRPTVSAAGAMQGNPNDALWNTMAPADQEAVLTIVANFAKAIGAYERLLVNGDAPFDRFLAGDASAISEQARQGAALFVGKARCAACHHGPHFTDDLFHNLGEAPATDTGRFGAITGLRAGANVFSGLGRFSDDPAGGALKVANLAQNSSQTGAMRTPSLRNVALTAPYLRTGRLTTLEQVMSFYNAGGGTANPGSKSPLIVPLGLNQAERDALVAFLRTLTGQPLPAHLTRDTSVAP